MIFTYSLFHFGKLERKQRKLKRKLVRIVLNMYSHGSHFIRIEQNVTFVYIYFGNIVV